MATTLKVEVRSKTFRGLAQTFKDFSRTPPKIPGVQVLHEVGSWNHAATTGFLGTVLVRPTVCREEDANEGAGWWKEGHESIKNPGWGCSTCETRSSTKATPPFEKELLEVQHQKGMQVVTKTRDGCTITQSMVHFKKVPYQTSEKARRWKPRPDSSPKNSLSPMQSPPSYHRWRNNLRKSRYWSLTTETLGALGTCPQSSQRSHLSHTCLRKPVDITREYLRSSVSRARFTWQNPVTKYNVVLVLKEH